MSVRKDDNRGSRMAPENASAEKKTPEEEDPKSWTQAGTSFLGKKFSGTSRLVVSSKKWMNSIPTRDCDVLVTFPPKTDDNTLIWLLSRLQARVPDLVVQVRHHSNTGLYGFYLTASYDTLLRVAEELSIRKPIKTEYGGGKKEFVYEDQEYFEGVEDSTLFLTSQERQSIVQHMLYNLRAVVNEHLGKVKFLEGQAIVPILMSKNVVQQVLPLHNNDDLSALRTSWVKAILRKQPLSKICEYFGVKIAMYFAYLGHYTRALLLPTLLGIIMWFNDGTNQSSNDVWFVVFAAFNVLWATLYLEHWKRTSAEKAYCWGTLDKEDELLTEPRPLFHGYTAKSPVTGRPERRYPAWRRNLFRYCVSWPIIAICLLTVFVTMWCIFEFQDWINARVALGDFPSFIKFIPKVLLAITIGIFDDIYKKIAHWLNDKENYRLEGAYETHLIIKMVLFQFVNSFLSLFYIAFYLRDMNRLKDQLATLLITRQVIGNIKEAVIPFFLGKAKLVHMGYKLEKQQEKDKGQGQEVKPDPASSTTEGKKDIFTEAFRGGFSACGKEEHVNENGDCELRRRGGVTRELKRTPEFELSVTHTGPQLTQAEVEASQKAYEDTFEDYLEMLIQFGYVTLFSSAFPLAALCALINNVIEIRSDAFKLCFTLQRPFGQRVENIGTWQDALEVMSVIAVMVNCALIGMSGLADRLFPDLSTTQRIIFIVLLEHAILIFKFLLAYAIPDIPHWVAQEKARLEFLRREALKKLESTTPSGSIDSPTSPPGSSTVKTATTTSTSAPEGSTGSSRLRTTTIITTETRQADRPGGESRIPTWEGRSYGIPESLSFRRSTANEKSEEDGGSKGRLSESLSFRRSSEEDDCNGRGKSLQDYLAYRRLASEDDEGEIKRSQTVSTAQFGLQRAANDMSAISNRSINIIKRGNAPSS